MNLHFRHLRLYLAVLNSRLSDTWKIQFMAYVNIWVLVGNLPLGLKWSGGETDHSTTTGAKVNKYTFTPPYAFMIQSLIS
jgi:hypothetical protein